MSDTASTTLRDLLQSVVNAPTWEETRQVVLQNQALLLTKEADAEFASWIAGVPHPQTLSWYREVLQRCRTESIDAAFNALPEPRPLNKALRAFLSVDGPEALAQAVQNLPEMTTDAALETIHELISQVRSTNPDRAEALLEHFTMLQMIKLANRSFPEDLLQLLTDWINTATWDESKAVLQANAEHLLTDEAIEALMAMTLQEFGEDQDAAASLIKHRGILEKARADSIDAAYADILKPSPLAQTLQSIPVELRDAIQAMINVESPAELRELVAQTPILLTEQATQAIEQLLTAFRAEEQEGMARHIDERFTTLKEEIETQRDPSNILLQSLLKAQTPSQLQQIIDQHPTLLDDETLNTFAGLVSSTEQSGNAAAASILRLRLGELRRIRQQREQDACKGQHEEIGLEGRGHFEISAEGNSLAIGNSFGPVTQNNQNFENYESPDRQWQMPAPHKFDRPFVGRQQEQDTLLTYLTGGESVTLTGQTISTTLQGMAGIGKTYLARKLAIDIPQRFPELFPGGVIWVKVGPPIISEQSPQVPLRKLASHAFGGFSPVSLAGELDPDMVASWLTETAPGRLLVIFDDVWRPEDLRFLTRAVPTNTVLLVTTRQVYVAKALAGHRVDLGLLSPEDGLALLENRLDCQNDTRYQADLKELVALLGGHALALDIAVALVETPAQVHRLLEDLRQEIGHGELSRLTWESEDRDDNLEASLALSYKRMSEEQQRRFRALGIFAPETLITAAAAAAIWGADERSARKTLTVLKNLALLTWVGEPDEDAYRQHSLLRSYALALLTEHNELTGASWSLASYYADLVWQAVTATPSDYPLLDQHLQNILAALQWSADSEPALFSRLLDGSAQFLRLRGQLALLETYLPKAVSAAAVLDKGRQANLLQSLGDLERHLGHLDEARSHYDAALPLFEAERSQLGQANVYMSVADMFLAQKEWEQARTYYEQALPLFIAERTPLGHANTLIDLGRVRFELGDHEQGMRDVQQAAILFRSLQSEDWARRAEQYLAQMQARLERPESSNELSSSSIDKELLDKFLSVKSSYEMLQLTQEHPELLTDEWSGIVEALIAAQEDEGAKQYLSERLETLKQIRQTTAQGASLVTDIARSLDEFIKASWSERRQLLSEQSELLLNEAVEPVFDILLEANKEHSGAIKTLEVLRVLLRRSRTWSIDATFHFELQMRLGDSVDIPAVHEEAVMQVAALLARQREDKAALAQAVDAMETLLHSLPDDTPGLFRAALQRDLADAMVALPEKHPLHKLAAAEAYYREALPAYQAAGRPMSVAFIQRSLGDLLTGQGRYEEALEPLQATSQGLREVKDRNNEAAWVLSSYANALDRLGRQEEALAAFSEAIALLPESAPLLRNRAETLIFTRRMEQAEADLVRAVELDGNESSPYLWFRRAQLAIVRGNADLAEQMIEEVLTRDASFDVLLVQAQSAWLRGDLAVAQEKLRQALHQAHAGDRAALRREMERLLEERPQQAGNDTIRAIITESGQQEA